jgi:hypothetical protein
MACGSTQQYRHLLVIIATLREVLKKILPKYNQSKGTKEQSTWKRGDSRNHKRTYSRPGSDSNVKIILRPFSELTDGGTFNSKIMNDEGSFGHVSFYHKSCALLFDFYFDVDATHNLHQRS